MSARVTVDDDGGRCIVTIDGPATSERNERTKTIKHSHRRLSTVAVVAPFGMGAPEVAAALQSALEAPALP
ncbi:MAG: hypothetical protein AAGC63_11565, partial [Propionicimonas sp.]